MQDGRRLIAVKQTVEKDRVADVSLLEVVAGVLFDRCRFCKLPA
jgi:hypothetical protein